MKRPPLKLALATLTTVFLAAGVYSCAMQPQTETDESQRAIEAHAQRLIDEGRKTFRYDTFGSEAFWGATRLHDAIAGEKNGGARPGGIPHLGRQLGPQGDLPPDPQASSPRVPRGRPDPGG